MSKLENEIGFISTTANANLREKDKTVYVFDTEKSSFSKEVHKKIETFVHTHDLIRSSLEKRLKKDDEKETT